MAPANSLVKLRQSSLSKVLRIWLIPANSLQIVLVLQALVFSWDVYSWDILTIFLSKLCISQSKDVQETNHQSKRDYLDNF